MKRDSGNPPLFSIGSPFMSSYLGQLTMRLASGAMQLDESRRRRHAQFVVALQNADGGFSGREGASDLYYTGFALRALALLGALDDAIAARASAFLGERLASPMPSIDFLSLASSAVLLEAFSGRDLFAAAGLDRRRTVESRLAPFHCADGGFAKTEGNSHSSTYHTFLAATCLELVESPISEPEAMIACVRGRCRDDGGFVELAPLRHSGTNPTAAAVGLMRLLDAIDEPTRAGAVEFLRGMQWSDGGFRANAKIPIADLLSTFTGLIALADLNALPTVDRPAARRFVERLEQSAGGFCAGAWDDRADVEYTFYGLGALSLLAASS
jgi:geranylgeranyl transferase type-2 subunit beta